MSKHSLLFKVHLNCVVGAVLDWSRMNQHSGLRLSEDNRQGRVPPDGHVPHVLSGKDSLHLLWNTPLEGKTLTLYQALPPGSTW